MSGLSYSPWRSVSSLVRFLNRLSSRRSVAYQLRNFSSSHAPFCMEKSDDDQDLPPHLTQILDPSTCNSGLSTPECKSDFCVEKAMSKLNLTERKLAEMWNVSPKTLQRWRTEGRGPRYLKLSKKVVYPLEQIRTFESKALSASTSERVIDLSPYRSKLVTAKEAAAATGLPTYVFCNKKVREAAGLPCLHVNSSLRFNLEEVMNWARHSSAEVDESTV